MPISPGPTVHGFRRHVTSIFPQNDPFTENATHYGARLTDYIRIRPWGAGNEVVTPYNLDGQIGDLHSAYFGTLGGGVFRPGIQLASVKAKSAVATADPFYSFLWRRAYLADVKVSALFRLLQIAGTVTTSMFRWIAVGARCSGAAVYTDTAQVQEIQGVSGYWFMLLNRPGTSGGDARWILLRVNTATPTLLASSISASAANAVAASLTTTGKIELTVEDSGGNPVLTGRYNGATVISFTDTSGSKITAAGRCGFGTTRDRQESAGANRSAHVIPYWEVYDINAGGTAVRDSWDRVNLTCNPAITDDNGTAGRILHSIWTLDISGRNTYSTAGGQNRVAGADRIQTTTGGGDNFSQIAANDLYQQARSIIFNVTSPGGTNKFVGIYLRAAFDSVTGLCTKGYRCRLAFNGTVWQVQMYRIESAVTAVLISTRTVTSGYSLAIGVDFKLYFSVTNLGGTGPSNGTPSLKVFINDVQVTGWGTLASGVTVGGEDNLLDGASTQILEGSANGILLDTSAITCQYDEWTDELATPDDPGDEDHTTISVTSEIAGKTGTFSTPHEWPVEVVPRFRVNEHRYDSNHVNRILRSKRKRRRFRIHAGAITDAERTTLLAFYDSHKGMQIPFDMPDPERPGTLIAAHFAQDELGTILRNPNVHSFDIEIEELLDPAG